MIPFELRIAFGPIVLVDLAVDLKLWTVELPEEDEPQKVELPGGFGFAAIPEGDE
ncbi:hypothetical protein [Plantactinospora sp. WMMB782]|uniref:hypothetical protein n=1 Tax=Plantactinospora sp. WMMB782 TaxID=3404121 RepID=UPI003B9356CF